MNSYMSQNSTVIQLSLNNILETARNVIRPTGWQCEWNAANNSARCKIFLTCWNAYLKHLILHCQEQSLRSTKKGSYTCLLPRCNVTTPGLAVDLKDAATHIPHAHLARVQLVCPISKCNTTFSRPALLEVHFGDAHPNLIDAQICLPSEMLLPIWQPVPAAAIQPPVPLPARLSTGCVLLPPIKGTWQKRPQTPLPVFIEGSSSSQLSPSKRRAKMDKHETPNANAPTAVQDEMSIMFDDLPKQLDERGYFLRQDSPLEGAVRNRDLRYDLARSQKFLDPTKYGVWQLSLTTSYEAFLSQNPEINEDEESDGEEIRVPTPGSTFTSHNPAGAMTLS